MLASNFQAMADSGDAVMRPFLQDVMKFGPFARTVLGQILKDPLFVPQLVTHVGVLAMADWLRNFIALGWYELLYVLRGHRLWRRAEEGAWDGKKRFRVRRWVEALRWGSGRDH
jgi:lycopene cyclase CruP